MKLGEKIRTLRKARKLTQEQLAEYMNVSSQAVSKWETGASSPDIEMLPRLAAFFHTTPDELLDFDRRRIDAEVAALVTESVPLRAEPERAEAFYREALRKYPNNEVLLNCLLMVIPNDRSGEKIEIGERLLDCTTDDEIRYDVLRLLALCCHHSGEQAMAEAYLARMPELYFLKTEIAAAIRSGREQEAEIEKTENVCLGTLCAMLQLRGERERGEEGKQRFRRLTAELLDVFRRESAFRERAERIAGEIENGSLLSFYQ